MKIEELEKQLIETRKTISEIELKLSKIKEEEEFKVGEWYTWNDEAYKELLTAKEQKGRCFIYRSQRANSYDSSKVVLQFDGYEAAPHWMRKATPSEIEQHLIKEAEKKGFVIGATIKHSHSISDKIDSLELVIELNCGNNSILVENYFKRNGGYFLCALTKHNLRLPLPECKLITSHPSIYIGSHKVEFYENSFKVGRTEYPKERVIELYNVIKHISGFKSIQVSGYEVTLNEIKSIADYYTKKP